MIWYGSFYYKIISLGKFRHGESRREAEIPGAGDYWQRVRCLGFPVIPYGQQWKSGKSWHMGFRQSKKIRLPIPIIKETQVWQTRPITRLTLEKREKRLRANKVKNDGNNIIRAAQRRINKRNRPIPRVQLPNQAGNLLPSHRLHPDPTQWTTSETGCRNPGDQVWEEGGRNFRAFLLYVYCGDAMSWEDCGAEI